MSFPMSWDSPEWALMRRACANDNTTLLDQVIFQATPQDLAELYNDARTSATQHSALAILYSLIAGGVDIKPHQPSDAKSASTSTLSLLLAQGWDINARLDWGTNREPFMWLVVTDIELEKWCLDHGASVHQRDQEPLRDDAIMDSQRGYQQILEEDAAWGSIETFELLRSKGTPLGWRPLHLAVETATYFRPSYLDDDENHASRMAMVRHLIDVVRLDVNARDQPVGSEVLPIGFGTPICYMLARRGGTGM